jgi:Quercetinase C-terminal cupin domain
MTAQDRNEQLIRRLYHLAEAASKDTQQFVSLFADGGYFYDVSGGKKYYGSDIGLTVDVYAAAFPDMHRELDSFYFDDNVVIVELSLNGTHKGDLALRRCRSASPHQARHRTSPAATSFKVNCMRAPMPRLAYLVPSSGAVDVNCVRIHARDGAAIKDVDIVTITAIEDADVVMVDVL